MKNNGKKSLISEKIDDWAKIEYPEQFLRLESLIKEQDTASDKNSNRLDRKINFLKRNFTDNYELQVLKQWNQDKFFRDVESIEKATSYKNLNSDFVCFGFSPSVYYLLGYEKVPFFMSARHVYTCMKKDGFIHEPDTHYHNLGIDTIKSIPFNLDNVILIAQSIRHPESIVSVLDYDTPLLDENNNPTGKMTKLQVFIKPRREDISLYYSNLINEGNLIATSYDLSQTIDRNKILYINKDKESRVPQLVSADMQSRSITAVGHPRLNIHNIKKYFADVKREMNISLLFNYALLQSINTNLSNSQEKSNKIIEDCIKDSILHEPSIPNLVQTVPSVSEEVNNFEQKQAGILDIVGKRFDVDEKGTPTFEGMKAISRAMEIYSDKHYETARYLFIKDGQIMRHIAVSAQTPASTVIRPDEKFLFSLRDYAEKTESKIVFLHNHPSGYVEPSDADIKLTNYLANFFNRNGESLFAGHIILDHGTYGLYTEKTREWGALIDGNLMPLKELRNHYKLNVSEKSRIATFEPDSTISTQSLKELSEYARQCDDGGTWNTKEWIPCLLLSSNGVVSNFDVINNYEFENIDVLSNKLKHLGREYSSENIVLFPRTSRQFLIAERFAQLTGKIKDIYFEKNDGTFELSQFPNGNIFNDLTRGDIKVSDSESYAEEVKVKISKENENQLYKENKIMENEKIANAQEINKTDYFFKKLHPELSSHRPLEVISDDNGMKGVGIDFGNEGSILPDFTLRLQDNKLHDFKNYWIEKKEYGFYVLKNSEGDKISIEQAELDEITSAENVEKFHDAIKLEYEKKFQNEIAQDLNDKFHRIHPELSSHSIPEIRVNEKGEKSVVISFGKTGPMLPAFEINSAYDEKPREFRNFFLKEKHDGYFTVSDGNYSFDITAEKFDEITSVENVEKFLNDIEKEYTETQERNNEIEKNSLNIFEYDGLTYIPVRKLTNEELKLINNRKQGEIWINSIIEKPKNGETYSLSDFMQKAGKENADLFYCIERGKFFTPVENGIVNLNEGKIDEHFRNELQEFYNEKTIQKIIHQNRPLKFNKEKDLDLMQNISFVLTEGDVFLENNTTLGDIRVKYGNNGKKGLSHIIKRRMDKLIQHDGMSAEDAQKETSAILFLALQNIPEAPATKETNGRYAIYKNGIKTVIDKDKQGRFVFTGFDFDDTKQEAQDAIKSVNAQYGYTPEFLEIYAQVGATYASLSNNISQSQENSNNVSIDNTQRNSNTVSQTEEELRKELATAKKQIQALEKKLEETLGQNNNLQRENTEHLQKITRLQMNDRQLPLEALKFKIVQEDEETMTLIRKIFHQKMLIQQILLFQNLDLKIKMEK